MLNIPEEIVYWYGKSHTQYTLKELQREFVKLAKMYSDAKSAHLTQLANLSIN
jgi:hypothetical protein